MTCSADLELATSDADPDEDYLDLIKTAFLFGAIDMGQVKLVLTWLELESATASALRRSH
jgi:hypothetical protein